MIERGDGVVERAVERIVEVWPARFDTAWAKELGFVKGV